jgi:hypothetical protein
MRPVDCPWLLHYGSTCVFTLAKIFMRLFKNNLEILVSLVESWRQRINGECIFCIIILRLWVCWAFDVSFLDEVSLLLIHLFRSISFNLPWWSRRERIDMHTRLGISRMLKSVSCNNSCVYLMSGTSESRISRNRRTKILFKSIEWSNARSLGPRATVTAIENFDYRQLIKNFRWLKMHASWTDAPIYFTFVGTLRRVHIATHCVRVYYRPLSFICPSRSLKTRKVISQARWIQLNRFPRSDK